MGEARNGSDAMDEGSGSSGVMQAAAQTTRGRPGERRGRAAGWKLRLSEEARQASACGNGNDEEEVEKGAEEGEARHRRIA